MEYSQSAGRGRPPIASLRASRNPNIQQLCTHVSTSLILAAACSSRLLLSRKSLWSAARSVRCCDKTALLSRVASFASAKTPSADAVSVITWTNSHTHAGGRREPLLCLTIGYGEKLNGCMPVKAESTKYYRTNKQDHQLDSMHLMRDSQLSYVGWGVRKEEGGGVLFMCCMP